MSLPYDGEIKEIEITNKEDLSKVIEYLNSFSIPATSDRPKDAINKFSFKDDNGNVIKEFSFGDSGVLWVTNETYILGSSNINTLKNPSLDFISKLAKGLGKEIHIELRLSRSEHLRGPEKVIIDNFFCKMNL